MNLEKHIEEDILGMFKYAKESYEATCGKKGDMIKSKSRVGEIYRSKRKIQLWLKENGVKVTYY